MAVAMSTLCSDELNSDNADDDFTYMEARKSLEALLSNAKASNATLEEKFYTESLTRTQREREVEEHKGLWESEVRSRSKLGIKIMNLEKEVEDQKKQIEEEQRKTRRAIELKKAAEGKLEIYEQRSIQHQKEVSALKTKLKQYQKKLKACEKGDSRIPTIYAEFDRERQAMFTNVASLRKQLEQLSEKLLHEQEMRSNIDTSNREQLKDIADLKTKEKVFTYEKDRLEKSLREKELELEKQKKYYEMNYIPREEIEEYKRAMETKASLDVNKKLQEVNQHLEEQSLAREAFEKLRLEKEAKSRKETDDMVSLLKAEVTSLRTGMYEGLAKRDTSDVNALRFKELFETERSFNDKLANKLEKTNERLAMERNRTNILFEETLGSSPKVSKKLFEESPEKNNITSPRLLSLGSKINYSPKNWSTPISSSAINISPERDYINLLRRRNLLT